MPPLPFFKYHGLGNDFVVVDLRGGDPAPSPQDPAAALAICDRRFGVGGDGVLAILPAREGGADARMRVINADGSEAEMCGNGLRCVAKHLFDRDPALRREVIRIETGAGVLACGVTAGADGLAGTVSVEMGRPRLLRREIPMAGAPEERCLEQPLEVAGRTFRLTAVSMGNPHAVAFVDEAGGALRAVAEAHGPALETHPWFPQRTNAEFARVLSPAEIELVVWERGCGITSACGTGACATATAACLTGRAAPGTEITVRLPGGPLAITVAPDYGGVTMRGPATLVYEATLDVAALLASAPAPAPR
jgi:diaminopimelate epimerase